MFTIRTSYMSGKHIALRTSLTVDLYPEIFEAFGVEVINPTDEERKSFWRRLGAWDRARGEMRRDNPYGCAGTSLASHFWDAGWMGDMRTDAEVVNDAQTPRAYEATGCLTW